MGVLLGAGGGFLSTALYLLLGGLGVPWFAGASGGVVALAGPTAGYLAGFILAACFTGYMYDRYAWARRLPGLLLVLLAADLILILGTGLLWLGQVTGVRTFKELLMLGWLPFISGDLVKIAAVAALARAITPRRDF
jgi:biotin transport system substrate-specific component